MPLLQAILDNKKRLICLYGNAGLGKTSIVRNMLHYIVERKFFLGGTIYLKLNEVHSLDKLLQVLFERSLSFF